MYLRELPRTQALAALFAATVMSVAAQGEQKVDDAADSHPAESALAETADQHEPKEDAVPVVAAEEDAPIVDNVVTKPNPDAGELPADNEREGVDLSDLPPTAAPVPSHDSGDVKKATVITRKGGREVGLAGINLIPDKRKRIKDTFLSDITPANGVVIKGGLSEPPSFEDLQRELAADYIGKPLTFGGLEEIVKKIQSHYLSHGRMLTHVFIPSQVMDDKLIVAVLEGKVTALDAEASIAPGRSWWESWYDQPYSLEDLSDEVRGELGGMEALEPQNLNRALIDLNMSPWARLKRPIQHPFRQVNAKYSPVADLLGETEVTLLLEQERPLRFFLGVDNTLTQNLGQDRLYLGSVWYDAFGMNLDHQLAVQFFYGLQSDSLEGYAVNYIAPWKFWGGKHTTEAYFAYTQSSSPTIIGGVPADVTGESLIGGFRHYYELPNIVDGGEIVRGDRLQYELDGRLPWMSARKVDRQSFGIFHEVGAGLDFKSTDNDLEFGGLSVAPAQADILQFVIEYNARQTDKMGETNLSWKNFINIGGSGDAELGALRFGAQSSYYYTRVDLDREQDLPWGTFARGRMGAQYATTNLLQSEQMGVGGFNTVRGYPERVFLTDTGWLFSMEYYSPAFHPLAHFVPKWGKTDELRFLVFTDWGGGGPNEDNPADPFDDNKVLGSVGLGLRYDLSDFFRLRLDYGVQLSNLDAAYPSEASDNQFHFGVVGTF